MLDAIMEWLKEFWNFIGDPINAAALTVLFAILAGSYKIVSVIIGYYREKDRIVSVSDVEKMIEAELSNHISNQQAM